MSHSETGRRARLSAMVDAESLEAVDRFGAAHQELCRSAVLEEALRLWAARERERDLGTQFLASQSTQER